MALRNRIKEARLNRGLTQEQLANIVGVAKSTITGYEKGNRIPTAAMVGQIADATGVDANFLYQDELIELYKDKASPDEFENIIKKYRKLDKHGRKMVDFTLKEEYERVILEVGKVVSIEDAHAGYLDANAAHELPNASTEDKLHDEDIMNDDNF